MGSVETLVDPPVIEQLKAKFNEHHCDFREIQLHKQFEKTKVKVYHAPIKGHAYIIGADPSMGTKSDFHALNVFDITNTFNIKQVASYYENDTSPKVFAYIIAKLATLYNNAYVAMENNGCSQVTLDALWRDYEYDNIITEGGNVKTSIGIHSSNSRKVEACLAFKELIEDPTRDFEINDGHMIAEMETFEKRTTFGKVPTYGAANGHDDIIMSTIWAFFSLKLSIVERYYEIKKVVQNKLGEEQPLFIMPYVVEYADDEYDKKMDLDSRLNSYRQSYEQEMIEAENASKNEEFEAFIKSNNLKKVANDHNADNDIPPDIAMKLQESDNEDEFTFSGFFN